MRKLSIALMVVSLLWVSGLSAAGATAGLGTPGSGNAWQHGTAGLPIVPFGDDSGGSH